MPQQIIERDIIEALIDLGYIVIACGGGGIPVLRDAQGDLQGLEAVIDKDFASSLLARDLGAELFVVFHWRGESGGRLRQADAALARTRIAR